MAATELKEAPRTAGSGRPAGVCRTLALTYLLLWAMTIAAAFATRALELAGPARGLLGLRLSPSATPTPAIAGVAAIALHNLPVCGWPLLLPAAGATRSRRWTRVGHALVVGSLAANALLIGTALGAYGPRLLAYTPQLALEWLALATGATGWLAPQARLDRRARVIVALLVLAVVLAAAALESYAVPHTPGHNRPPSAAEKPVGGQTGAVSDTQPESNR